MAINNEAAKEDRSEELIEQYNKELREIYGRVMQNEHMAAYQAAKNEFDALMQRVTGVLSMCAEGQDPDGCDPDACGCTGSCATCGGGCQYGRILQSLHVICLHLFRNTGRKVLDRRQPACGIYYARRIRS